MLLISQKLKRKMCGEGLSKAGNLNHILYKNNIQKTRKVQT